MRKLSLALLVLFIFSMPWGNTAGRLSEILWVAALVCTLATCILERRITRLPALVFFVFGLVVWQTATYYWSIDPSSTLVRVRYMLLMLAVVWMVVELANTEGQRLLLAQAFVVGCFVLSGALYHASATSQSVGVYRYGPGFLDPNDAADMLAAGMAMALLVIGSRPRIPLLILNAVFVPVGFFAVILTGSRDGFIVTCLAATGIFFVLRHTRILARLAWVVVIVGIMTAAFLGIASSKELSPNLQRVTFQTDTYSLSTLTGRTTIWSAGIEQFAAHPLAGVGAGTFAAAVSSDLGRARAAHNLFIEEAVETGVIGLAFLIAAFLSAALPVLRQRDQQMGLRLVLLLVLFVTSLVGNLSALSALWLALPLLAKTGVEALPGLRPTGAAMYTAKG